MSLEERWAEELRRRWAAPAPVDLKEARELAAWELELADVPTWGQLAPLYGKEGR